MIAEAIQTKRPGKRCNAAEPESPTIPSKGKRMTYLHTIGRPHAATIADLIAGHILAKAEHDKLFELSDHGLADEAEVTATLDPLDDALIAICAARPADRGEQAFRAKYLRAVLPNAIASAPELAGEIVEALVQ